MVILIFYFWGQGWGQKLRLDQNVGVIATFSFWPQDWDQGWGWGQNCGQLWLGNVNI